MGETVDISGNLGIAGAPSHDFGAEWDQGAVYVFRNLDTATGSITESVKLVNSDGHIASFFGDSLSISGTTALVGAIGTELSGGRNGAIYIYRNLDTATGTITESARLVPTDVGYFGGFGASVSFEGTMALAGASRNVEGSNTEMGAAYIYRNLDTATGDVTSSLKLISTDRASNDEFGYSVSLSGNSGLVGAHFHDLNGNDLQGAAYLYRNLDTATGTITQNAKLISSDGAAGDFFGYSLDLSGTIGIVGSYGNQGQGAAYVFRNLDTATGTITESARLIASDGADGDLFGSSVAISGTNGIVGARRHGTNGNFEQGAAYLYTNLDTVTGVVTEAVKLYASNGEASDVFGYDVSMDGDRFIIGAPGDLGVLKPTNKAYTGNVSTFTTLNTGGVTQHTDGLSFDSRTDWVIGDNTVENVVYLSQGDRARVTAPGATVYVGRSDGALRNELHILGTLEANRIVNRLGNDVFIGNGGSTGVVQAAEIVNNGGLFFNHNIAVSYDGLITGAGYMVVEGTGPLTLTADNTMSSVTDISSGSTLLINGDQTGGGDVRIYMGGTLGGSGVIGGSVEIFNSGTGRAILSPGGNSGIADHGVGTLTINGALNLSSEFTSLFNLNQIGQVGAFGNDLVDVNGNLVLDGALDIIAGASFREGAYRLFNYGGTLTDQGIVLGDLNSVPAEYRDHLVISTAVNGQVNLIVAGPDDTVQLWDGPGPANDGNIQGGNGSWTNFNTNFASASGSTNSFWRSGTAIFTGTAGTVTVDDEIHVQGIQIMTDGYQIVQGAGGPDLGLVLDTVDDSAAAIITDADVTATISANISGVVALEKMGAGTLILTGNNSYMGGTIISSGVLQPSADNNLGDAAGDVTIHHAGTLQYGASFDTARDFILDGGAGFGYSGIDTNGFNSTISGVISGVGGIHKSGAGILTLTNAANNFELGAMVMEGTLVQGAAGAFTANAAYGVGANGTLDLNDFDLTVSYLLGEDGGVVDLGTAVLTVDTPTSLQYGYTSLDSLFEGSMIGAGSLVKEGDAILAMTGASTYSGGTSINAGTLQTGNLSALGTGPVALNDAILEPITTLNISQLDWNDGNVKLLLGPTLLNITGDFTNGGTGGEFQLAWDNITPLVQDYVLLTYGGTTNFTEPDFSGDPGFNIPNVAIQHTFVLTPNSVNLHLEAQAWGPLLQNSAPVFIPTFADFFVQQAVTTGTPTESNIIRSLHFDPGTSLQVFNNLEVTRGDFTVSGGKAVIHGGTITVPGNFNKYGAGTLDARTDVFVVGNSYIHSGALAVNGRFQTELMHVLPGGTLMGNGIVIGNVLNAGTVAPGNSIGLLTIAGNYTQTRSGTLQIEAASPTNHDILVVTGTAQLDGTLEVIEYSNRRFKYGDQFPFLRAGNIVGKFDEISVTDPEVNRGRFFTAGNTGIVVITPASYTMVAETQNQRNVAGALDKWIGVEDGDIGIATLALDLLTEDQYPQAFEVTMPKFYEGALSTGIELSHSQGQMLHQQLSARRLGARANRAQLSQRVESSGDLGKNPKSVKAVKTIQDIQAPQIQSLPEDYRVSTWFQGSGLFSSGGLSLNGGEDFESGTFLAGADYAVTETFTLGLFAGYGEGWGDYDNGGQIDLERILFGGYATIDVGNFYLNAAIGGGSVEYDIKRPIQFATLDRTAKSDPDGMEFFALLGGGYDFRKGNWTFGPQASLQYSKVALDSFTERGADSLNLRLHDPDMESLRSYLGARVAYTIQATDRVAIIPEVRAFWQHEFMDGNSFRSSLDGGAGPDFNYEPERDEKDSFIIGAGLGFQVGTRFYANIYYNADLGREEPSHNVSISATVKF